MEIGDKDGRGRKMGMGSPEEEEMAQIETCY